MATKLVRLSLFLALPLSRGAQLRSVGKDDADLKLLRPGDLQKDLLKKPRAAAVEKGKNYVDQEEGCKFPFAVQPKWAKSEMASKLAFASQFNDNKTGWSGFCQAGLTVCPGARVNQDYMYYARIVGDSDRVMMKNHSHDAEYCRMNGFLSADIAAIVHDFEALQARGVQECKKDKIQKHVHSFRINDAFLMKTKQAGGVAAARGDSAKQKKINAATDGGFRTMAKVLPGPFGNAINGIMSEGEQGGEDIFMTEEIAEKLAAWNCAMGDLACDLAYCNYAYCHMDEAVAGEVGVAADNQCKSPWKALDGAIALARE